MEWTLEAFIETSWSMTPKEYRHLGAGSRAFYALGLRSLGFYGLRGLGASRAKTPSGRGSQVSTERQAKEHTKHFGALGFWIEGLKRSLGCSPGHTLQGDRQRCTIRAVKIRKVIFLLGGEYMQTLNPKPKP